MSRSREASPHDPRGASAESQPVDDREEQRRWFRQLELENHGDLQLERDSPSPRREKRLNVPSSGGQFGFEDERIDRRSYPEDEEEEITEENYVPLNSKFDQNQGARRSERHLGPVPAPRPIGQPRQPAYPNQQNDQWRRARRDIDRDMDDLNNNHYALPAPMRHTPAATPRIKMKPEHYDGKEDFDSYLDRFETCALLSGWTRREQTLVLATLMNGAARTYFQTLPDTIKRNYHQLIANFQGRFGSTSKHTQYWVSKFNERMRKNEEPIATLADEILLLAQKAYPRGMTQDNLHQVALQQLYKSLDPEARWKCIEARTDSMGQAVEIIETYEAFAKGTNKKAVRLTMAEEKSDSNDATETIQGLLRRVDFLENKTDKKSFYQDKAGQRKSGQPDLSKRQCFLCMGYGHLFKSCPRYDEFQKFCSKKAEN